MIDSVLKLPRNVMVKVQIYCLNSRRWHLQSTVRIIVIRESHRGLVLGIHRLLILFSLIPLLVHRVDLDGIFFMARHFVQVRVKGLFAGLGAKNSTTALVTRRWSQMVLLLLGASGPHLLDDAHVGLRLFVLHVVIVTVVGFRIVHDFAAGLLNHLITSLFGIFRKAPLLIFLILLALLPHQNLVSRPVLARSHLLRLLHLLLLLSLHFLVVGLDSLSLNFQVLS